MDSTMQLLDRALATMKNKEPGATEAAFSRSLGLNRSTLAVARSRGNLSPVAAGQVAALLGEPVDHWMAVAALEAAPKSRATEQLRRMISAVRKSSVNHRRRTLSAAMNRTLNGRRKAAKLSRYIALR